MSCVLDNEERPTEVVIGWDSMTGTFFARVWDRSLYDDQKARGVPEEQAGPAATTAPRSHPMR